MRTGRVTAVLLAISLAGAALSEAPARSIRAEPRPAAAAADPGSADTADAAPDAADAAVTAALASALAVLTSPRPLPRPLDVVMASASAAVFEDAAAAPRTVATDRTRPADPIAAFFQGLAASKPAAPPIAAASALAVPSSPRPEDRPDGFARLVAAITPPRATSRAGSVCGVAEIKGEALKAIDGTGACGIAKPVRVSSVSGIPVSEQPVIDCDTAIALNDWVRGGVIPAVGRTGGGLARVNVIAHYSCRSRNNVRGAKLSEHSFGHAIDIGGVTLKDGTTLTVEDDWKSRKYGGIVKAMHASACGTFGTVLGPNSDRYHYNHIHLDTARYRAGAYCR